MNNGRTEQDLRRLGHDLRALLEECESLGLTQTGSRHFRLGILGPNYPVELVGNEWAVR